MKKRKLRKISVTTSYEPSMLEDIDEHIEQHSISFAEFIRRAVASYLDHNQTVTNVSVQDSEPIEQPPEVTPGPNGNTNGDFNWDDMNIE